MNATRFERFTVRASHALGRFAPWYRQPRWLGLISLMGIRSELRAHNLYDPAPPADGAAPPPAGGVGSPFGRNQPLWAMPSHSPEDMLTPSPREISERLLARTNGFQSVGFLNLLAASWLQFMVHDWLSHGTGMPGEEIRIPLDPGDRWAARTSDDQMLVRRTKPSAAPTAPPGVPVFDNTETHWWDGSQIYGSTPAHQARLREGARLRMGPDGLLPLDERAGVDLTGVNGNWWLGLALMHTIFAREHNRVCDMLAAAHPDWDDERLFETARRVTAAVMAKIHTVEWTPSVVPHKTVARAMRGNWYGLFGPGVGRMLRRITRNDVLTGILGSRCDDNGVPFSLTEEFVAVYRMHPLLPDQLALRNGAGWEPFGMTDVTGPAARELMQSRSLADLIASLGHVRPGKLALHNYPDTLRDLRRPTVGVGSERHIDLAAVDIVRDRERGIPRYNDFRRMLRLEPVADFETLTGGDAALAAEVADVYGDMEKVDLMIGLYAEPLLPGFGFSETAFRIFILMASRRLKADPYYTDDFRPEVYSAEGMQWVADATMAGVIAGNVPELAEALAGVENPFAPWGPEPVLN